MNELALCLIGDSAHTPPSHIVEDLSDELAHRRVPGAPHTIYEELWHAAFWQQQALDRIDGVETSFPEHNDLSFPSEEQKLAETWAALGERFWRALRGLRPWRTGYPASWREWCGACRLPGSRSAT